MPEPAFPRRLMSVEEYLQFEESTPERHEYVAGEVYAMSGASRRHGRIIQNISFRLMSAARGGPCEIHTQGLRLRAASDRFYYPDVMALCTPGRGDDVVVHDPCLVIEVTSRSTARIDRGEKLDAYRRLASLRAYLIVDQARRRVVRHWRDASGAWQQAESLGDGSIAVPCPETALPLGEIYEGVDTTAVTEPEIADYEPGAEAEGGGSE